ncbi:MAG TPA: formylglycine-generating enzyme family protein [Stellaceae bacterium]|jgi:formylglycine-generating enzyme required for sulfatase activity|nr:formylglycine-generating enzyme family protein [Stellaceae bacterium]
MRGLARALAMLALIAGLPVVAGGARAGERIDRAFRECPDCPEMVAIPAGKFVMGSPATERGRFDAEGPQHAVAVRAFAIGKYDVTNAQFLAFLQETAYQPAPCDPVLDLTWHSPGRGIAYPPGRTDSPLEPAVCLSWNDAQAYLVWLNRKVGASLPKKREGPYRLPSEAEWEYAARAGSTTARWWGEAIGGGKANCHGCGSKWDGSLIAPVGSFGPNPFGVYDMLGNVWQWVDDCWNESYVGAPADGSPWLTGDCGKRVLRGGSWSNVPEFVRSASRSRAEETGRGFDYSSYAGFRVARTLP